MPAGTQPFQFNLTLEVFVTMVHLERVSTLLQMPAIQTMKPMLLKIQMAQKSYFYVALQWEDAKNFFTVKRLSLLRLLDVCSLCKLLLIISIDDSVSLTRPEGAEYCIYNQYQAYAEYLIKYT